MNIHGLQKMTLLDYPGKVAATIFLGGCNFRCGYCHNFELVEGTAEPVMTKDELFDFLKKRKGILDGVCVTGGEPCLRDDLPEFLLHIKNEGYKVKLDTNGHNPDMLLDLINKEIVDYVAMDIKNSREKYAMTVGLLGNSAFDINKINKSVEILLDGKVQYEFRTTVVDEYHEESDFLSIGQWIKGASAYYLQQYTERDTVPDRTLTSPCKEKLQKIREILLPFVPNTVIRGV